VLCRLPGGRPTRRGEDDDDGRERRGIARAAELHASPQVAYLCGIGQYVIMPPCRVRAGGQQTDHGRAENTGAPVCLAHPLRQRLAVGRIHPAGAPPRLAQAVLYRRVIVRTSGVMGQRRDIGVKVKLRVQPGE